MNVGIGFTIKKKSMMIKTPSANYVLAESNANTLTLAKHIADNASSALGNVCLIGDIDLELFAEVVAAKEELAAVRQKIDDLAGKYNTLLIKL